MEIAEDPTLAWIVEQIGVREEVGLDPWGPMCAVASSVPRAGPAVLGAHTGTY